MPAAREAAHALAILSAVASPVATRTQPLPTDLPLRAITRHPRLVGAHRGSPLSPRADPLWPRNAAPRKLLFLARPSRAPPPSSCACSGPWPGTDRRPGHLFTARPLKHLAPVRAPRTPSGPHFGTFPADETACIASMSIALCPHTKNPIFSRRTATTPKSVRRVPQNRRPQPAADVPRVASVSSANRPCPPPDASLTFPNRRHSPTRPHYQPEARIAN